MTHLLLPDPVTRPRFPGSPSRPRRLLRSVAVVACLPYLCLKVAWIAGSHLGIPQGSPLLTHRTTMAVANGITVLMDGTVIVLSLLLTRPWGLRVPAWMLAVPMWPATGLLAPIMTGFPLQLVVKAFDGNPGGGGKPFLDAWVFGVVYSGFIVQGLALGTLFGLYARDRWGRLWRGRVCELPASVAGATQRATAVAAAVLALWPATLRLLWSCGATTGLSRGRIADRGADSSLMEVLHLGFLVACVTGAWLLAFRRGRALRVAVPLALAWVGSGAAACWGAWMLLASLPGVEDTASRPTPMMSLTYAVQMIVGILVAALGAHFLAERSAAVGRHPSP